MIKIEITDKYKNGLRRGKIRKRIIFIDSYKILDGGEKIVNDNKRIIKLSPPFSYFSEAEFNIAMQEKINEIVDIENKRMEEK